jgi:hypothetical protein
MDRTMDVTAGGRAIARPRDAARQSFRILQIGFVILPTLTGLDKFFHVLTNWDQYLAPTVEKMLPIPAHTFMLISGVVELCAALWVALQPRVGAWVVAAWLLGIIVNFFLAGGYYDIALRDFGLMLGAIALARLAAKYERPRAA